MSRIFLQPQALLPPLPSHTRFVCISDTHSRFFSVPPGDVLLHAGDLSSWGKVSELKKTINWVKSLPHPVKITRSIIAGNHDLCLDQEWASAFDAAQELVRGSAAQAAGIYYLEHESVEFTTAQGRRWKVYGSPAAPRYVEGAFQYSPGPEGRELYARIPADTDILLTHTPPYQVNDLTRRGKHAGCPDLADRIRQLEELSNPPLELSSPRSQDERGIASWNCKLHVWGHIHEDYGWSIKTWSNGERVQVNAALAGGGSPVVVDLHN